ncbi:HNH endonuclease signature motif containing protein [Sinorhizobium medicae]|uniref:HNH endonuclease signature motif containing protein n=1 Tax=Sinorhizobium medicae TaxID=110321 RepID=UPI00036BDD56|nr:HNH endonuclease signature motif containing protein [Sinorhizobium medicae]MDX0426322.1 HNH endonuclease [Sinorhizobium medicae]
MSSRRDRIRAKIMSRVRINPVAGCWEWTGPDSGKKGRGKGYPRMSLDGQTVAVHIAMWTNEHGYIPGKKELDHACRNRLCVRPEMDHVEMVTRKENAKRREQAKRSMIGRNGGPKFECQEMEASS